MRWQPQGGTACFSWRQQQLAQAATITTPNGQTAAEGKDANCLPFSLGQDVGDIPSGVERYQQVYSASEFASLASGGEFITQIAFRPDVASGAAFTSTLPSIRIDLSTTTSAPDLLSTSFAGNSGGDDSIVYGGASGAALLGLVRCRVDCVYLQAAGPAVNRNR